MFLLSENYLVCVTIRYTVRREKYWKHLTSVLIFEDEKLQIDAGRIGPQKSIDTYEKLTKIAASLQTTKIRQ